jgi:hypothetical protein
VHESSGAAPLTEPRDAKLEFIFRWSKARSRWRAAALFDSFGGDVEWLGDTETMFEHARAAGVKGDDYPPELYGFARSLPPSRYRSIKPPRLFHQLAFRQWQRGRAELVRGLLAQHTEQRRRELCGLGS